MIDQTQVPVGIDLGVKRELSKSWSALYQRPARIVANATEDRRANAGRADHGMRFTIQWFQSLLKLIQRGTWQANDLAPFIDQVQRAHAHGVEENDRPIVSVTVRRRTAGEPCICGLKQDDQACFDANSQRMPLLNQASGADDGEHWSTAATIPNPKASCFFFVG